LEKFEKFAGKYENQIFALIFGGTSLAGLAQQDPNRPQNAVNVQVWHAVLDDEYAGDMATAESNMQRPNKTYPIRLFGGHPPL